MQCKIHFERPLKGSYQYGYAEGKGKSETAKSQLYLLLVVSDDKADCLAGHLRWIHTVRHCTITIESTHHVRSMSHILCTFRMIGSIENQFISLNA